MKLRLISFSLIALLIQPALAVQADIPNSCPSIAAIENIGVNNAWFSPAGPFWFASNSTPNKYDTNVEWQITIGLISDKKYKNETVVLSVINKFISVLSLQEGPILTKEPVDAWECKYMGVINKNEGLIAVTRTPPNLINASGLFNRFYAK